MLPDGRRLGAHLPLGGGMVKAVERAHEIGAEAIQVFADNPTAWRRRERPPAEAPAFRHRLASLDIRPVAIHAPYLVNLAGPDEEFFAKSVAALAHELVIAPAFDARFVNVHIGSHRGTGVAAGSARVAEGLGLVLAAEEAELERLAEAGEEAGGGGPAPSISGPGRPLIVLENSAGGGFGIGATVEELAAVLDAAGARGVDAARLAFCLDTAHAWGAGYLISDPNEVDALVASFDRLVGLDRLAMVHLNDSKADVGVHADRHEHVGAGRIGPAGMARFLSHPRLARVTYYLETPGMDEGFDAVNVARALALARGDELPELPAGAEQARGGSGRSAPESDAEPMREPQSGREAGSEVEAG
jgi:deoxyribonuclease-4